MLLIGLCGPAGAGKDSVADALGARWDVGADAPPIARYAFARPIKEAAAAIFGLPLDVFEDPAQKDALLPALGRTPRSLLQLVGTDWVRVTFDERFWIHRFEQAHALARARGTRAMIVTDVRFPNEADAIRDLGGTIVRVARARGAQMDARETAHPSEACARALRGDVAIDNDGTLCVLRARASALYHRLTREDDTARKVARVA